MVIKTKSLMLLVRGEPRHLVKILYMHKIEIEAEIYGVFFFSILRAMHPLQEK